MSGHLHGHLTLEERVAALERRPRARYGFVISFMCFVVLLYAFAFQSRSQLIAQCERGNLTRDGQLSLANNLVTVNKKRVIASSSPAERRANQFALRRYRQDRNALIAAVAPVAVEEGSVTIDCESVYERPWPLNYVL